MKPTICTLLALLLLSACAHTPPVPDAKLVDALAAVRADGPRLVRGGNAVRAHLRAQERLSDARGDALRRWCVSVEGPKPLMAETYCPRADRVMHVSAPPGPADIVGRNHEPDIHGGDWLVRMGDHVLVANQGSLTAIDISGAEGAPMQVADSKRFGSEVTSSYDSSVLLWQQSGQFVLCSVSVADSRSVLLGLALDGSGKMQQLWRLEVRQADVCSYGRDRVYLYPDALLMSFDVPVSSLENMELVSGDVEWLGSLPDDEVLIPGQVASWEQLRHLVFCALPERSMDKLQCRSRTILSGSQDILHLAKEFAYILLHENDDSVYLEPWMSQRYSMYPQDFREDSWYGWSGEGRRETWVLRVPLRDERPIKMVRLGGWLHHQQPAGEVDGDLYVLTRQRSASGRRSLALHRLEPSVFDDQQPGLLAPSRRLRLRGQECFGQWMLEGWAWFWLAGHECGWRPSTGGRAKASRLRGMDLRTGRERQLRMHRSVWLTEVVGNLFVTNDSARVSLQLEWLPLDHAAQSGQVLEVPELREARRLLNWGLGPDFAHDIDSGRLILGYPVVREQHLVDTDDEDGIPQDLLLLEVEDAKLRVLAVTDSGSGWHPSQIEPSERHYRLGDGRLLVTAERVFVVESNKLTELLVRDGQLIAGEQLSF